MFYGEDCVAGLDECHCFRSADRKLLWSRDSTATIDIQDNMPSLAVSPLELQSADLNQLGREFLVASDTAMLCANWVAKPQMRILYSWLVRVTRS